MRTNQPQMRGGGLHTPKPETPSSDNQSKPQTQGQSSQERPQSLQEKPKTVVRSGGVATQDPNNEHLDYDLRKMNLRFSPEMSSYDVTDCQDEYKKMPSYHTQKLIDAQSHGFSLEELLSISKVVTPISLFLHNHISYHDAVGLAFTGSDQIKDLFTKNLRLAEHLKDGLRTVENFKGTAGAKAACRAAIRELEPTIEEFNNSIGRTLRVVHAKKLENYFRIFSSRQRTAELARKGILIESLEDFKFLRNAAVTLKSFGYVAIGFEIYSNYKTAIGNISNGADEGREFFVANAKTLGEVGASGITIRAAGALSECTCGLSLVVGLPTAKIFGEGIGWICGKAAGPIYDLFND